LYKLGKFEEAIASYDKAIEFQPDCYEAWNNWDLVVKQQQNPFPYWLNAKETCTKALEQLTFEQSPPRHLTVLQYLLKICSYLGDTQTFDRQLEKGRQQLDELLRQCKFETEKINLERKFAAFTQLRVDILAQSSEKHQQIAALETAEKRKNTCLSWLREGWDYDVPSPNYQQMQQLLNPKTAAIYWHLSPLTITTFILIDNQDLHVITDQIDEFETWFKEWKSDYQTYRNTPQTPATKAESPWRTQISSRLEKLREILDIKQIVAKLPPQVNKLILIPHRDLHLLPLHYLFSSRNIAYLPSFQIGLHLQQIGEYPNLTKILNVENPRRDLPFATIQNLAISQLHPQSEQLEIPPLTRDEIIQKLAGDSDTFNFTGHGYHDIEQPQNSALLLADTDKLTLEDIFSQSNNLDFSRYSLICLCACESGIASQQNLIDEYVGLVSAFLAKRASCVVSTLWNVDEQSTALLMIQFYTFIAAGKPPRSP
jgi:CHAT domain-containing protein